MKLIDCERGTVIADQVATAYTFWKRLKGLMFKKMMPEGTALHLKPCRSIHTFFMNFSIDVIYLDKKGSVVGLEEQLEPGKTGKKIKGARSVIELPGGTLSRASMKIGQAVALVDGKIKLTIRRDS